MKVRESGMPDASVWATFFDVEHILDRVGVDETLTHIVDFGSGYGHFAIPAAKRTPGKLTALDMEPAMLETAAQRAQKEQVRNIEFILRDFVATGTGLKDASVDFAFVFNLLHLEDPQSLLREVHRILTSKGQLAIIHWNHNPDTPRGPPMSIRPRPEQCLDWASQCGFAKPRSGIMDFPPYHYGMVLTKDNIV